jgi:hypothetical protein
MQDLFQTAPLKPNEAHLAYPLVRMFDPAVSLRTWLTHARRLARRKPDHGGLVAVRDRRGVLHALFSYQVDKDFRLGSCLRIGDLIVGRLPGAIVNGAVLTGAQTLAETLGCDTLLIDVPTPPAKASALASLAGGMVNATFAPSAVTFLRRSGRPAPIRANALDIGQGDEPALEASEVS